MRQMACYQSLKLRRTKKTTVTFCIRAKPNAQIHHPKNLANGGDKKKTSRATCWSDYVTLKRIRSDL